MDHDQMSKLFDVSGLNILVTGGAGVLCSAMAADW